MLLGRRSLRSPAIGIRAPVVFGRRMLCNGADPLRVLGLKPNATDEEIKAAWRQVAKRWHPDRHVGDTKAHAEEQFKAAQRAYDQLTNKAGAGGGGGGGGTPGWRAPGQGASAHRAAQGATSSNNYWGTRQQFGEAHRAGYNTHKGYMGFHADNRHWYEDTANAAKREDHSRMVWSWVGLAIFAAGLWLCAGTAARDRAKKERGELVDAWFNQTTRRWEKPPAHMFKVRRRGGGVSYVEMGTDSSQRRVCGVARGAESCVCGYCTSAYCRSQCSHAAHHAPTSSFPLSARSQDPFLSSLVSLKPPDMVYNATPGKGARRKTAVTLDGSKVDAAYRAREQGMRG